MKKTVLWNTAVQILGKVISGGLTFLISLVLARQLGVAGYGDFIKITTYVAIFYLFSDFGLNAAYVQLVNADNKKQLTNTLFTLRLCIGVVSACFALLLLLILPSSGSQGYAMAVKIGIILFTPSILLQALLTTTNAIFQKNLRYLFSTFSVGAGAVFSFLTVFLVSQITPLSLNHILGILLFGSLLTVTLAFIFAHKLDATFHIILDSTLAKQLLTVALPLGFTLICNVVYFHADSFILTLTRPTEEVGIYGLAYKFFELVLVIPTFFMNAVFPLLVQAKKSHDADLFHRRKQQSLLFLFAASIAIVYIGWMTAPLLYHIRPEFAASRIPMQILFGGVPVFFLTSFMMWLLVVGNKQRSLLRIYGISMVGNIIANLLFVPLYGYIAAAWITVISELFVLVCSTIAVNNLDKTRTSRDT